MKIHSEETVVDYCGQLKMARNLAKQAKRKLTEVKHSKGISAKSKRK